MASPNMYFGKIVANGELANQTGATRCPEVAHGKMIGFKAPASNTDSVYVSQSSTLTASAGTTNTTAGWALGPGEEYWIPVGVLHDWYYLMDGTGARLLYQVLA